MPTDKELMQQALDAMLNFPNDISDEMFESIRVLRARLAQPEQPQIVWIDNKQTGNFLNIAPPQREWQGLTDAEIRGFEIWLDDEEEKHGWNPPADIVKYIEAKLKEKNT